MECITYEHCKFSIGLDSISVLQWEWKDGQHFPFDCLSFLCHQDKAVVWLLLTHSSLTVCDFYSYSCGFSPVVLVSRRKRFALNRISPLSVLCPYKKNLPPKYSKVIFSLFTDYIYTQVHLEVNQLISLTFSMYDFTPQPDFPATSRCITRLLSDSSLLLLFLINIHSISHLATRILL